MSEEAPLTILFTDVEGSTDLRTRRGDAAAHEILRAHEEVVRGCVARHGGREVKALGDGFMIAFASARKALACAVAIQQVVEEQHHAAPGGAVRVRIGVNTGEVVEEGGDLYGQAVNAAARIAARAKASEILVADVTRQLVGLDPELAFSDRGRLRLKGFPDRWRLFELAWAPPEGTSAGAVAMGERTPYVGREAERAELRRLLDAAVGGTGALVMIGGEPGVGKTRLAEELMAEAERRDLQVFAGHSYEMEGAAPYVAIVEIMETALARAPSPQAWRQFLGDEAPEVAKLVPKLRRLCPDIPPPLELPAEQERRLLFNSVRAVVERSSRRRPLLLMFDDLHWADEPTLLWIGHLAEQLAHMPVLVVATYRDTDVDIGRPLAKTFEDLRRRRIARWMTLTRFPAAEVARMLGVLSGQPAPAGLVEAVYQETEGNPFFVEEVYKHLAEEGRLFDAEGHFRGDLAIGELDVPAGVRLVVGRRLQRLDIGTPPVLTAAAVVGRAFSVELLEAMDDLGPDAVLDAVEDAERARLIVPAPDASGEDRFIFAHELIRQTLLAELSLTRRRRLHARVADALERHYAARLDQQAAAIAYHLVEAAHAGDPRRAFGYLVRAARWAMEGAAFEEAVRHYERAVAIGGDVEPGERAELLFELGVARRSTGRNDTAIDAWRQSLDAYEQLGDEEAVGRVCVAASYSLALAIRFADAVEMCERGLAALGDRISADRARLLGTAGVCVGLAGSYQAGADMIDREISLAGELDDDAVLGHALRNKTIHRWGWLEHEDAAEGGLQAAELLRSAGDLFEGAAVLGFVVLSLVWLGRLDDARRVAEELEPLAERVGCSVALMQAHRAAGMGELFRSGDCKRFEAFGQAHLDALQRQGLGFVSEGWAFLGVAAFLRGDWQAARSRLEEARRGELVGALRGWEAGLLFECLAYLGQRSQALALLDDGSVELPRPGQPNGSGAWCGLFSIVEGLTVLGERDRAGALYELTAEAIERTRSVSGGFYDGRLLQRAAGVAAFAGCRWELAETHFIAALKQAGSIPHRPEEAHTRRWYGQMLLERKRPGDREQAEKLLHQALDDYERMDMPRHRDLVAALLGV